MAIITRFYRSSRSFQRRAKTTECEYRMVTGEDGVEYLQLVTSGSEDRQDVGSGSQNIRVDETKAAELVDIIFDAFPGIEARTRLGMRADAVGGSTPMDGE